jgi:hypothetical protein
MLRLTAYLWLAALPCAERQAESQRLARMAEQTPALLPQEVAELEARLGGMPLYPQEAELKPEELAEAVQQRFREACALREAAEAQAPASTADHERLQAILSRPEFAQARQRQGDVLGRLLRELGRWLEELLETRGAESFAVGTRAAVLGLGVAAVLFALLRLRHWRRGAIRGLATARARAEGALVLDSPAEHLARARQALAREPREAIREGLLALLSTLEQRRLARPDRVRTNRELVAELPGRGAPPALVREVERLVRWYDQAFYSLAPVGEPEAARFVEAVEQLHQQPPAEGATV